MDVPAFLRSGRFWVSWLAAVGAGVTLTVWFLADSPPPVVVLLLGGVGIAGGFGMIREILSSGSSDGVADPRRR